ncbi:TonB-dependent receptor [Hyphococcus sp.]|uniref:TonB-dependent receptor n=1 Tax=Hyphococcus sp. TaxID=2038636 RepID=UPI002085E295|nr:MAG: ferrichrome-iron receptor [Marinicaulis sp.]
MRLATTFSLTSIIALGLISGAAAADNLPDEIVVNGKYLSIDKLNAVKAPTPIIDVPQSLTIISEDQIAEQSFTNIGDVLRYTPGLSISQGEGHRDAIIIRGNQTTADFFIDGLRDDVQYFRPLYNVQQIEILRGSNALLFGRGGGGGVVNRVTKTPVNGQFAGMTASADTFGAYSLSGDVNYSVGDSAGFRLNGFYEELNNHRDFYDGRRFAINPTFALDLTPSTSVLFSYEYLNDDRVVDRGVPSVTVAGGPDAPLEGFDKTFFGSPDQNFTTLEAHIVRAKIDHTFSDFLRGNITAQFADYAKLYQNIYTADFDAATNMITMDGYQDMTERQNLIFQGNLIGEFATGPFGHTVLFGAEYGDQDTANARNDNFFTDSADDQITFLFSDPLNIPEFAFSTPVRGTQSDVKFTSVYLQDQIDVTGWLKIVAGVRFDRFDLDVVDAFEVADGDTDGNDGFLNRVDEEISPRFGVILKPSENVSFYGSYSESFLPRSGDQFLTLSLTEEALKPQFFKNTEIGAKWDITPALSLSTALFRLERESVTTADPLNPGNTLILDGTITKGFELQLSGEVTDRWTVNGGVSVLDGEVDGGGADGNVTAQTPDFMFSLWNHYDVTDRFGVGLGVTHQSAMFVGVDNSVELPGYTRVDAAVFYDVSDAVRVQVNLENLLDESYFPDAHSNDNISTGEPLNARFTVSARF